MKNLIFFCDRFTYTLDHATLVAENMAQVGDSETFERTLVVFSSVESHDTEDMITEIAKDLRKIARKNSTQKIVVNPFAHLSSHLANPEITIRILDEVVARVNKEKGFEGKRLHFG